MLLRQQPDRFYAYPDHRPILRRALWHLGFDPLTVYERLNQVRAEATEWKAASTSSSPRLRMVNGPAVPPCRHLSPRGDHTCWLPEGHPYAHEALHSAATGSYLHCWPNAATGMGS